MELNTPEQFRSQLENIHAEVSQRAESTPEENRDEDLHREIIHQVVGERLGKVANTAVVSNKIGDLDPVVQGQVDMLVEDATTKDLEEAINKARKSKDPVIIDAFHDALVGKLFDHLVSDGKLKNLIK